MQKGYVVEFCNLELRFERRQIQSFVRELIQEGYSLYWNESEGEFFISIRMGRKLLKLYFQKLHDRYKMIGDYVVRDERLTGMLEKLINTTRGHAVVKRVKERQTVIENIMFGEIIRSVEVIGMEQKIIFQKKPTVTTEDMMQAFQSKRAEERVIAVREELDRELMILHEAMILGDTNAILQSKGKLELLRIEMLRLEM
ncbi:hypothetical protein ACFSTH_09190 [Paenibacillus yanchengensis]|uniref:DUF3967 domain-containing protein n=1 Tax=Paenibacillus yanchengensis TaxID=2035833 RepID=A0ABW4YKD6_9BACL